MAPRHPPPKSFPTSARLVAERFLIQLASVPWVARYVYQQFAVYSQILFYNRVNHEPENLSIVTSIKNGMHSYHFFASLEANTESKNVTDTLPTRIQLLMF